MRDTGNLGRDAPKRRRSHNAAAEAGSLSAASVEHEMPVNKYVRLAAVCE